MTDLPKQPLSPERARKLKEAVRQRQPNLTVILENVYDRHNIAAVVRSAESIGIGEIFILYTERNVEEVEMSKRSSAGSRKWVDIHLYNDADACFKHIRSKYKRIIATHLGEKAESIYSLDLTDSTALLFGNEHVGLSERALQEADANMIIPQAGMTQSLNISVASAVTLYEAYRQRMEKGYYSSNPLLNETEQAELYDYYVARSRVKGYNLYIKMTEDR
ncbi:MAG: TrmH family RNA methyltransferase [Saprospiraceae bacterium]